MPIVSKTEIAAVTAVFEALTAMGGKTFKDNLDALTAESERIEAANAQTAILLEKSTKRENSLNAKLKRLEKLETAKAQADAAAQQASDRIEAAAARETQADVRETDLARIEKESMNRIEEQIKLMEKESIKMDARDAKIAAQEENLASREMTVEQRETRIRDAQSFIGGRMQ